MADDLDRRVAEMDARLRARQGRWRILVRSGWEPEGQWDGNAERYPTEATALVAAMGLSGIWKVVPE